jgi:hypothetical protein
MLQPDKVKGALYALHFIMVQAKAMCYRQESSERIALLLDWGEILPQMLGSSEDETERFRGYLQRIVEDFPKCTHALEIFDGGPPNGWCKGSEPRF